MKICADCNIEKEETEFCKRKVGKDGLMTICRSCNSKRTRAWREENKERYLEDQRKRNLEWRRSHGIGPRTKLTTEEIKKRKRQYYESNKERFLAHVRTWQKDNPDKNALRAMRYKANKLGAPGHHTYQEWADLLDRCNHKCISCGSTDRLQADHIIPLSKGGTNFIDNIQPLCQSCNAKKHTQTTNYLVATKTDTTGD
jgi:5-methylcytosine-specific restriction endonuclease McrA